MQENQMKIEFILVDIFHDHENTISRKSNAFLAIKSTWSTGLQIL